MTDPSILYQQALDILDSWWDGARRAVLLPEPPQHDTRITLHYALGLLQQGGAERRQRATECITTVLGLQWDAPGTPYHGTFARVPGEFTPGGAKRVWHDYDPNMREFLGCVFALILDGYVSSLPAPLLRDIEHALHLAAEGAYERAVTHRYTNAALMSTFLLDYAGARTGNREWTSSARELGSRIYHDFETDRAFPEYNSPTYYGVDLGALAQWRSQAPSAHLRRLGAILDTRMRDGIALVYHPRLANLCGPYIRSYGMDMHDYCALLWLWLSMEHSEREPAIPDPTHPFGHMHDISFVPFFTELIRRAPSAAHFETDSRFPRTVERTLSKSPLRRVVSWLDTHLMIGALHASATCSVRTMPQCSPATVHWETPDRGVGWLRLVTNGSVDAEADPMRLNARCAFDSSSADAAHVSCAIRCPGVRSIAVDGGRWRLPGINIHVGTDALYEGIRQEGDTLFVRYGLAHGRRSCEMNVELEV